MAEGTALARSQRAEWQPALHATRETWRRAYDGRASDRVDWAVAELEGHSTDGELDRLHGVA